jgi:hypothetical protein
MSWNDIMRRVLPPIADAQRRWNVTPYVKSHFRVLGARLARY